MKFAIWCLENHHQMDCQSLHRTIHIYYAGFCFLLRLIGGFRKPDRKKCGGRSEAVCHYLQLSSSNFLWSMTPCPSDSNSLVLPRPTRQPAFVNFSDKPSTGIDQNLSNQESFYCLLPLKVKGIPDKLYIIYFLRQAFEWQEEDHYCAIILTKC